MHWILIAHKLKFSGPWLADLCLKCLHATQPFLLEAWFDQYERDIEFNLAASTGSDLDRVPLAGERSERPPALADHHRAWDPASTRRLLRCALAFPPGLRRRRRQFLRGARPFRSFVKSWSAKMVRRDGSRRMNDCHRCVTLAMTARKGISHQYH